MSSTDTKAIVKKTQQILKEQGYDVKLSHVYELFSKLSGVKDWNSAKALNKDFSQLTQILKSDEEADTSQEIHFLINLDNKQRFQMPNSSKDRRGVFIINNQDDFNEVMDAVKEELKIRKNNTEESVNSLSRIVINMGYNPVFVKENLDLLRTGRRYGIHFIAQTAKPTYSDIPKEVVLKFVKKYNWSFDEKVFIGKMGSNLNQSDVSKYQTKTLSSKLTDLIKED